MRGEIESPSALFFGLLKGVWKEELCASDCLSWRVFFQNQPGFVNVGNGGPFSFGSSQFLDSEKW